MYQIKISSCPIKRKMKRPCKILLSTSDIEMIVLYFCDYDGFYYKSVIEKLNPIKSNNIL